jgi:TRAP-type mannitol/chloroaromatic compound transport system permease small subunit
MTTENNTQSSPKICDTLDNFVKKIGHFFMWTNGLLIIAIIVQVFLRYGLGMGKVYLEELQWHLYAIGIMFGASYAVTLDSHIRVDIVHANLSEKWRSRWDLFGICFLLLPFAIVVFHHSLDFVWEAIRTHERSDAPSGLPYRWIIKSVLPLSFSLLITAVISRAIRIIHFLKRG